MIACVFVCFFSFFAALVANKVIIIMASAFNRLRQYAISHGIRAYCYAELAVSSLRVAEAIANSLRLLTEGWPG